MVSKFDSLLRSLTRLDARELYVPNGLHFGESHSWQSFEPSGLWRTYRQKNLQIRGTYIHIRTLS
jgi:hypothetical protein